MREWFRNSTAFEKFCALAFVFLATLSCFATAQSLCLTLGLEILPDWLTFILAFILVFMIYVLTSYFFVQIINSLNSQYCQAHNIRLSERRMTFIRSFLGIILLWIVCSMPTNTHSMLYQKEAKRVASAELDKQKEVFESKLNLTDRDIISKFQNDSSVFVNRIDDLREKFVYEVNHRGRPGLGDSAIVILHHIEIVCGRPAGSQIITTDVQNIPTNKIVETFDGQIVALRDRTIETMRGNRDNSISNIAKDRTPLDILIYDITKAKDGLKKGTMSVNQARKVLDDGYSFNSDYKNEILDKVEVLKNRKEGHEPDNVKQYNTYRTERMYSVFNVWGDFFTGKLPKSFDMLYWIIWSLILDIAALIFSGIAFRGKV